MNKTSLIVSFIAVLISGCVAFQYEIDTNNASFTLGVLTALVTVLIAWNIYSLVDFNQRKSELSKETEKVKQLIALSNSTIAGTYALTEGTFAMLYYYLITNNPIESLEYHFVHHSLSAIVNTAMANREKECNYYIDLLLGIVNDSQNFKFKQKRVNELLLILETMPNKQLYSKYTQLVCAISKTCERE